MISITALLLGAVCLMADNSKAPEACLPVPTPQQVAWQQLETYSPIMYQSSAVCFVKVP